MTTDTSKPTVPEFKPIKKPTSSFVSDPYNKRAGGSKKNIDKTPSIIGGNKGGKVINVSKFKGGSGGDR